MHVQQLLLREKINMLHQEIKQYIITHAGVSLADLSGYFSCPPEQIRALLDIWVKNGSLKRNEAEASCKKGSCACNACIVFTLETYSWIGK